MRLARLLAAAAAGAALAACAVLPAVAGPQAAPTRKQEAMVTAAHPLAVEAGLEVLRRGGGAVDAAVAVQAMLGLVEPQSSGIAGGAFLMHYDAETGVVSAYNGREKAPAGASSDMFLDETGAPLPTRVAMLGGRATGVPGVMRMLELAHQRHGALAWDGLFEFSARTADDGFVITPRLAAHIEGRFPQASAADVTAFFTRPDGARMQAGDTLKNPAYARVLRRIAAEGPTALYEGPIAEQIVARTRAGPLPGTMTLDDLTAYRAEAVEPICRPFRIYVVCVPPPPSSGVALLQVLALLERTDIAARGPDDPQSWLLFAEASRLMYADRDRYVADPAHVAVPVAGLLDPAYLDGRARLIGRRAAEAAPAAGRPNGARVAGIDATVEPGGTTHFVVVDAKGDVVSMTTTVESYFGSGRMVEGFFLNNQLTDFSAPVDSGGTPAANAPDGGKRPRSSMSPTIVLDREGRFVAAVGSPGGSAILAYNAKALIGLLAWDLPMQQAVDLPNLVARGNAFNGETGRFTPEVLKQLKALGVEVKSGSGEDSGLHGVIVRADGLEGGADSRREGVVRTLK